MYIYIIIRTCTTMPAFPSKLSAPQATKAEVSHTHFENKLLKSDHEKFHAHKLQFVLRDQVLGDLGVRISVFWCRAARHQERSQAAFRMTKTSPGRTSNTSSRGTSLSFRIWVGAALSLRVACWALRKARGSLHTLSGTIVRSSMWHRRPRRILGLSGFPRTLNSLKPQSPN